jgi:hypothetical protein
MLNVETLKQEKITEEHLQLLNHVLGLVDLSRSHMQKKYEDWDHYDEVYRGIREPDEVDKKTKSKQEPVKMVVPLGFAQLQTFVAFNFSLFTQREYFFELMGSAPEDMIAAEVGEALLQRDLDHNSFFNVLYQFLVDIGRFGLGVIKCHWVEESQWVDQQVPPKTLEMMGLTMTIRSAKVQKIKTVKYQGNKITNISPYKFFPDPRLPLSRFQEGEFCASEDEYTYHELKKLEAEGVVFGIDFVEPFTDPSNNRRSSRLRFVDTAKQVDTLLKADSKPSICVTEVQVSIIPSKFTLDGKPLGEEEFPVKYLIWYANDCRIIRCEPLNYLHDEYTYQLAEMTPDMNHFLNSGLLESIDELQDVISWFINSHITSVRRTIQNQLVVDPAGVVMDDLKNRRSVIRLQPDASRSGVERWIKQLDVRDSTAGHVGDATNLHGLLQTVTGINENLLGQFHGGRRSATEARNVTTSAASRLKMYSALIFTSAIEKLGKQMLSNLRDGLSVDTYVRMFGMAANGTSFSTFKKVTRNDLIGNYDFGIFDGTLPSEKGYHAEVLQEVLLALLNNPQAILLLGLDPKLIAFEVMRLRGIRYPERFTIQQNLQAGQQMLQNGLTNPNGIPGGEAQPNSFLDGLVGASNDQGVPPEAGNPGAPM